MVKLLVLTALVAAAGNAAADQQFAGEVRRADGKPLRGIPVALVEDPPWWRWAVTVTHAQDFTDSRGRFSLRARGRRMGGRLALVAVGRVLQRRSADGTIVYSGTSVSVDRPSTVRPNIIVVPLSFQPAPRHQLANASNHAMQLTASKPAVYTSSVCRRERILRGMHSGLAAADLVSR